MRRALAILAAAMYTAPLAMAGNEVQVRVWYKVVCSPPSDYEDFFYDSGESITFSNITNCVERINIWVPDSPHTYDVGRVTLSGNSNSRVEVILGAGTWRGIDLPFSAAACRNWAGIVATPTTLRDAIHLEGRIQGDLTNSVSVGHVYRFEVDGAVNADITAHGNLGIFVVECGSGGPSDNFTANTGSITRIESDGDIEGNITAPQGSITDIIVLGDIRHPNDDGTPSDPDRLAITAKSGITLVQANAIYADVSANANGGSGDLLRLETTTGDYTGTVRARRLTALPGSPGGMAVAGYIDGAVEVGSVLEPIVARGFLSGSSIDASSRIAAGITATNGDLPDITAQWSIGSTTDDMTISAPNGSIGDILVRGTFKFNGQTLTGGLNHLVNQDGLQTMYPLTISAAGTIGSITCEHTPGGHIGSTGSSVLIESVSGTGHITGQGLLGDVTLTDFAGMTLRGDIEGDLTLLDPLNTDAVVSVAGSLGSGGSLDAPAAGIAGQVILNAAIGGGTWSGDVLLDAITMAPVPFYTNAAATVGGGAVGLVPFNYHPTDSEPDDDAMIYAPPASPVQIWFYGPVSAESSATSPLKIERRQILPVSQVWTDVTGNFTVTVAGTGTSRLVEITPGPGGAWFGPNSEHRFVP